MKLFNTLIILSCYISLIGCAGREWTKEEVTKEAAFQVLNVADYALTKELLATGEFHEANPLIGSNPSSKKLDLFCIGTGTLHWLGTEYFVNYHSPKSVSFWQNFTMFLKAGAVGWNLQYKF